ncbi:MAG: hypothetical protein J4N30_05240 [Chloroflexi bacterium]|nr:hypothetical protein [Chloroflexota bacterium]
MIGLLAGSLNLLGMSKMAGDEEEFILAELIDKSSVLDRGRITRRQALRAGGVAALGLAFVKPLVETIAPPPVHAAISAIATPTPTPSIDVCAGGRPTQLTFIYTGDLCTASSHSQGKAVCTDVDTAASGPVEIKYTGKDAGTKITVSPGSGASTGEVINVGNTFILTSTRVDKKSGSPKGLHSNSKFDILQGGNIIQQLEIHTSCSEQLFVGDQFGSLRVAGFVSIS